MKIRKIFFILVLVCVIQSALNLNASTGNVSVNAKEKIWIFFTDKGSTEKSDEYFNTHKDYITKEAKKRRAERGRHLQTKLDVPVNEKYINEIQKLNIKIVNRSKWLNAVTAYLSQEEEAAVSKLYFVKKLQKVTSGRSDIDLIPVEKSLLERKDTFADSITDIYNYGPNSENQIKMLNINKLHNMGYTGKGVRIALFDTGLLMTREFENVDTSVIPPETTWTSPVPVHSALEKVNIITSYDFVRKYPFAGIREGGVSDEVRQLDHGTKMLALIAGYMNGELVSPAFGADFLIAKTEIVDSEIVAEEDNWIRAVEWADSLGADIISSSLGYKEWHPYSVMTGDSAIISKIANMASDSYGILVVNSIGNIQNIDVDDPDTMIVAPADAYSVLTAGGVDDDTLLSTVSSTGPTYDMKMYLDTATIIDSNSIRYKPDICALAEWPYTVTNSAEGFNYTLGTSGSAALISGGCALIVQAHLNWDPTMIKNALYNTAYAPYETIEPEKSLYVTPNQIVGYGIADFYEAVMFADTDEVFNIESNGLLPPFPNPFSLSQGSIVIPFEMKRTISNLQLFIYTVDGKLVYYEKKTDLLPGIYDKRENAFTWNGIPPIDGFNFSGYTNPIGTDRVRPGVYIVMLETGFEKSIKKISIIP